MADIGGSAQLGVPDEAWDVRQASRDAHMLQSRAWASFLQALGREVRYAASGGWSWIGSRVGGRGYRYLYVPYGPTVQSPDDLTPAIESMRAAGREMRADFLRFEPMGGVSVSDLRNAGLTPAASVQPSTTRVLDLTKSPSELRASVSAGHRSAINQAEARGLAITVTSVLEEMQIALELIEQAATGRYRSHDDAYYERLLTTLAPVGVAKLGVVHADGDLVSAAIVLDHGGTRAYAHAGNTERARALKSSVPLVWTLIEDAYAHGLKRFDLWGVAPAGASRDHPWAGFSQFKRAFGGEDVQYAGTWDIPLKPLKTRVIALGRAVAAQARKARR